MDIVSIDPNAVYTNKEAMQLLKIRKVLLSKAIHNGEIKPSRVGNKYLYLGKDLLDFLELKKN
jgi:hypothetical protein